MTEEQPVKSIRSCWPASARRVLASILCGAALVFIAASPDKVLASTDCTTTPRPSPIEQDPGTVDPPLGTDPQPIRRTLPPCSADTAPASSDAIPAAVAVVLTSMASQAAVILVAQVQSIDREDAHGYVDISFHVQSAVRGTSASTYVLREWAGLWMWQQDRYHLGQRLLLLLHPRSSSGFSSPVGGTDGAVPLIGGNQPPLLQNGAVPADSPSTTSAGQNLTNLRVDLRWIAARALRAEGSNPAGSNSNLQEVTLSTVLAHMGNGTGTSADAR